MPLGKNAILDEPETAGEGLRQAFILDRLILGRLDFR